jgi:exonuclease III
MKLLTWNIRHGGGKRLSRIVEELSAHDPDVIALTEYRAGPGRELRAALADRGWPDAETTEPAANENGIAVFARTPLRRRDSRTSPEQRARWLDLDLPEHGFGIAILHIMAAGSGRTHPLNLAKARFWDAVLEAAAARLREQWLFLGDWNTGAHSVDEAGKTYVCAAHFLKLSEVGWTDLWRRHHAGATEWTWYSTRKGGGRCNGFRLDHAFATPALLPRVSDCRYSHRERDAGISDHSITIVELR